MPPRAEVWFYRIAAGAEIDLVLSISNQLWAIEVKHSTAPKLTKGFHLACQDINSDRNWVIYSGTEQFKTKDGVTVISLPLFLETIASLSK